MATHGVRKLGLFTGILMLLLLFIGGVPPLDFYILELPAGISSVRLYTWGLVEGGEAIHMLTLAWPSCVMTWVTTVFYMASVAMTLSASTPGSLQANSKRMFAISGLFCIVNLLVHVFLLAFSSHLTGFMAFAVLVGPGFWALAFFSVASIVSFAKVQ